MANFNTGIRAEMMEAHGYRCSIDSRHPATQMHHIKPNTKVNQKLFPIYLQSPMNMFPICADCHLTKPLPKPPSDLQCHVIEKFLRKLKNNT